MAGILEGSASMTEAKLPDIRSLSPVKGEGQFFQARQPIQLGPTKVVAEGFRFTESPRWYNGKFHFADPHDDSVYYLDENNRPVLVCKVPGGNHASGFGWDTKGRLVVVSMNDRKLLRMEGGELKEFVDLNPYTESFINDMVVDGKGRCYVGNFGFNNRTEPPCTTSLVMVEENGTIRKTGSGLTFPNGAVITPDGKTLIVAETYGHQLTAFDSQVDGLLTNSRVWARPRGTPEHAREKIFPDGLCLDDEGGIWAAVCRPRTNHTGVLRITEGGLITHQIKTETDAFACMLGGKQGNTLYICTSTTSDDKKSHRRTAKIETVQVHVRRAGWP